MKRLYALGIAILTLVALAGCNDTKEFAESLERTIVLTATHEGVSPDTKTLRMDDCSTWWNPKEEISVFYGSGSNGGSKFTSKNTTIAETTEFEGSISMSGSKEFWAVYPYSIENSCDGSSIITVIPSQQTGVEGNFSDNAFPAIGKSSSLTMPFYNICGGVKFFVSRTDIKSVTFKGNNGEYLAGKVRFAFNAEGKPEVAEVLDGNTDVTLTAPDGETFKAGKYYYITLLPRILENGFTMTFATASETGTLISDKLQTVKRSIFGTLKNIDSEVSEWERTVSVPEYVDLGLSVKWATFNLGASSPEEYGDYFAWGETEPKADYWWSTYKWCNDSEFMTKYNNSRTWGSVDNKTVLDPEDDAAYVNLGGSWRMPTDAEWTELRTKCIWTWTTQNGVNGRLVTGHNGNSIFLPAAGLRDGTNLYYAGSVGFYWSPFLRPESLHNAWDVCFYSDVVLRDYHGRCFGLPVRPVYGERSHPESVSLNQSALSICVGFSSLLTATVFPDNALERGVIWYSDNTDVATVSHEGFVIARKEGTATITATTVDGGKTAECVVTVVRMQIAETVDLGLSVKWASWNVGATKPEEYGAYFAWGETEPKTDYNWSNYKWCIYGINSLTKYCTNSSYLYNSSPMDNKTVLDPEDDAAHVNWGGSWRMPTDAEWTELRTKCIWTWTTQNGVNGRLVTGHNGKSIFLPAAGDLDESFLTTYIYYAGTYGFYWSSSLNTNYPFYAWGVSFDSGNVYSDTLCRYFGFSVRPVCPK